MPTSLQIDALAAPVRLIGPGESGGTIYEAISALVTDLHYPGGVQRVDPSALITDLDQWAGLPVVFGDGPDGAHDSDTIEADGTVQGRAAIGTVLSARYDAEQGARILRFVVHDPADAEHMRRTGKVQVSEAYLAAHRPPTREERAQGIASVQTHRKPTSVALVKRARAGSRARVRTDGAEPMAVDLNALRDAVMPALEDEAALAFLQALIAGKGKPAKIAMPAEPPMGPEMDAMKRRVDAAEAKITALETSLAAVKIQADGASRRTDVAPTPPSAGKPNTNPFLATFGG